MQTPARAGSGGRSVCALAWGPGGGHGCSERGVPAELWAGRSRQVDVARVRRSVGPPARHSGRPLWTASCGCSGFLFAARLEGGLSPTLFARVCLCACVQNISISGMKEGRWRPEESPQGGLGVGFRLEGRQAGCSRRQEEKLPPFQLFWPL